MSTKLVLDGIHRSWAACRDDLMAEGSAILATGSTDATIVVLWAKPSDGGALVALGRITAAVQLDNAILEGSSYLDADLIGGQIKRLFTMRDGLRARNGRHSRHMLHSAAYLLRLLRLELEGSLDALHQALHKRLGYDVANTPLLFPPEHKTPPLSPAERTAIESFFDDNTVEMMLLSMGVLDGEETDDQAFQQAFVRFCTTMPRWRIPILRSSIAGEQETATQTADGQLLHLSIDAANNIDALLRQLEHADHDAPLLQFLYRALTPYARILPTQLFEHVAQHLLDILATHPSVMDVADHVLGLYGTDEEEAATAIFNTLVRSGGLRTRLLGQTPGPADQRRVLTERPWGRIDDPWSMGMLQVMSRAMLRLPAPEKSEAALMRYAQAVLASTLASLVGVARKEPLWIRAGVSIEDNFAEAERLFERGLDTLDIAERLMVRAHYVERWDFNTTAKIVGPAHEETVQLHRRALEKLGEAIAGTSSSSPGKT